MYLRDIIILDFKRGSLKKAARQPLFPQKRIRNVFNDCLTEITVRSVFPFINYGKASTLTSANPE